MSKKVMEFSEATRKAVRAKGDCCWACGVPGWVGIEVDHIIPRNHPECTTEESNAQMLCSPCNNIKGAVTIRVKVRPQAVWMTNQTKMMQIVTKNRCEFRKSVQAARKAA